MAARYKLPSLEGKIIAIDGPSGSGKSTTARLLAQKLGFIYLDTGAMYRALTWFALRHDLPTGDAKILEVIANRLKIEFKADGDVNRVYVNGVEVTEEIRTPEVTRKVSEVSAHPEVRKVMVAIQKELGKNGHIVAEGRDTTSVVFPEAHVKVYLDASLEARAQRRFLDMTRSGVKTTIDEQKADLIRRDKYDSTRKASPLKKVRDALTLDTSHLTIEEQVERIIKLIRTKIGRL